MKKRNNITNPPVIGWCFDKHGVAVNVTAPFTTDDLKTLPKKKRTPLKKKK